MRSPNPRTAIANNLKTTRPTHETPFNDHCRAGIRTGACGAGPESRGARQAGQAQEPHSQGVEHRLAEEDPLARPSDRLRLEGTQDRGGGVQQVRADRACDVRVRPRDRHDRQGGCLQRPQQAGAHTQVRVQRRRHQVQAVQLPSRRQALHRKDIRIHIRGVMPRLRQGSGMPAIGSRPDLT